VDPNVYGGRPLDPILSQINLLKPRDNFTYHQFIQFSVVLTLHLCVFYLSGNNLQLLRDISPNDWFLKPKWSVFTARYALSLYIRMRFVFKGLIQSTASHPICLRPIFVCFCLCLGLQNDLRNLKPWDKIVTFQNRKIYVTPVCQSDEIRLYFCHVTWFQVCVTPLVWRVPLNYVMFLVQRWFSEFQTKLCLTLKNLQPRPWINQYCACQIKLLFRRLPENTANSVLAQ
jgi:hypothetical protein